MSTCRQYEIELSAMLDGESDPATAVALMDHISQCASCREFYRELRSFQTLVDDMSPAMESPEVGQRARRGWFWISPVPRWVWGVAAVLLIAIGSFAAGSLMAPDRGIGSVLTSDRMTDESEIDDERFLELASEVLRTDRRHQQRLYRLLGEIETNAGSGESLVTDEFDDEESPESYNEMFAIIGGRRVVN